jgi:hypothetical protein
MAHEGAENGLAGEGGVRVSGYRSRDVAGKNISKKLVIV